MKIVKPDKPENKTFGDLAYMAIAQYYKKILKHEAGVLKDKDPEELHQMRVGMRGLRSAMTGFQAALNLPVEQQEVGRIARILGKLRDLDVLGDSLKKIDSQTLSDREQKSLTKAVKVLTTKRKSAFKKVQAILKGKNYTNFKQKLQGWLDKPRYEEIAALSLEPILPDLLSPQVSNFLLHPGWLVGSKIVEGEIQFQSQLEQPEVEVLLGKREKVVHDLRKEAKRSRYNLELFTQFYGDTYGRYVKDIKKMQTVIGEIQDCFVLRLFLGDALGNKWQNLAPTLASQLKEKRYEKWQEWELLRRQFLNAQTKQQFRETVQHPVQIMKNQENLKKEVVTG